MSTKATKPAKVLKLSSLKADRAREIEGEWIDAPELGEGVAFHVSSLHKPDYQTARDLLLQSFARDYKGKPVPPDVRDAAFGKLYAEHILHDWRGFDVGYTAELARETLSDPDHRRVINAVEACAAKVGVRDAEFVEVAAKNSARPSAGA